MDTRRQSAYLALAQQLATAIDEGTWRAGQYLPPIRQLASDYQLSINTVRSALAELERQQLVESQPRKGVMVATTKIATGQPFEDFNPDTRLAEQSREWLNSVILAGSNRSRLVQMVPPQGSPLFQSFQRQYRKVLQQLPKRSIEDSGGSLQLRQVLADGLARRQLDTQASEIQITSGCQHALEHALRALCQPGDVVAIPVPAFPGYFALLAMLGLKVLELPLTPAGVDGEQLRRCMASGKVAAVLLNPNNHNPTGHSFSDQLKRDIAWWARRYRVPVLEDDICAELGFAGAQRPIASFDHQGWCLLAGSISKLVGDTERIGWCLPGRFKDQYKTQFAVSQISTSYFGQAALARYLRGSRFPTQLRQWRIDIHRAHQQARELLLERLGDNIEITQPAGGYALWVQLPEGVSAAAVRAQLKQPQVDILPGELFCLSGRFQRYFRLVVIPPFDDWYQVAIEHLCEVIEKQLS